MKKVLAVILCLAIVCSFVSCSNTKFKEIDNKAVVANDGTEYTFVGNEGMVYCFGEWEFIGHIKGEKKQFDHLRSTIKTGMYSVNGGRDVLVRYFPDNEFAAIYVKSGLLTTEVTLENCIRFEFVKASLFHEANQISKKSITDCERFLTEIKAGHTAKDAGLYDLITQPDGMLKNCYAYGYVCGVIQEDVNIFIPLVVMSFDDKAYSIKIDGVEYVLPEEWVTKFIVE